MTLLLVFAVTLMVAVLLSGRAHRTVLSTTVIFLIAGVLAGPVTGWVTVTPDDPAVATIATLALFAVLFTDGMHLAWPKLVSAWRLPGRALLFGLPLTIAIGALAAAATGLLGWVEAALVAAVLAPTDPVFASAIIGRVEVPARLRHLLNVESGLNDGLALPFVLVLITLATGQQLNLLEVAAELALGVAFGVAIPWALIRLERSRWFDAYGIYQPLNAFAMGAVVYAACEITHANLFLAAFAAGITVRSVSPEVARSFSAFAEPAGELVKLAAILVFGMLLTQEVFATMTPLAWLLALVLLIAVRPLALGVALIGSQLPRAEFWAAAWFGPKGFASVTYGLLVLAAGVPHADLEFAIIAAVIAASIVAHSTTDHLVARYFARHLGEQSEADTDLV